MQKLRQLFVLLLILSSSSILYAQTWKPSTNLPFGGTDGAFAFSIGDKVYFGGGSQNTTFYQFDPATNVWTKKAKVPGSVSARSFAVGFSIGGFGYVTTGQDNHDQAQVKHDLWRYDPTSDTWSKKADLIGPGRDGAMAFVVGSKAYVGGGADSAENILGDFYSYDPATDHWTQLSDLPFGPPKFTPNLFFSTAFSIGKFGYVTTGSVNGAEFGDLYRYDPTNDSWTKRATYPGIARQAATSFVLYGKGYVGLGMRGYSPDSVYADFYSYDPSSDKWTPAPTFGGKKIAWAIGVSTSTSAFVGGGWNLTMDTFTAAWYRFDTILMAPVKPGYSPRI